MSFACSLRSSAQVPDLQKVLAVPLGVHVMNARTRAARQVWSPDLRGTQTTPDGEVPLMRLPRPRPRSRTSWLPSE
jgi:hypothetical protein